MRRRSRGTRSPQHCHRLLWVTIPRARLTARVCGCQNNFLSSYNSLLGKRNWHELCAPLLALLRMLNERMPSP
eukprot:11198728-Lingulodinium_polyedra.AAC.1